MTTQAKNRVLAYIVLAMLFAVMYCGVKQQSTSTLVPAKPVTIVIPKDKPVLLTVAPSINQRALECLRLNVYHEAGNQSLKGKQAVALLVMQRVRTKSFPSTVCGVVTQAVVVNGVIKLNKCQFSWHCDGKSDMPNLHNVLERKAWEESEMVARAVLEGKVHNFLGRATHYCATYSHPAWVNSKRMVKVAQIGDHVFYRDIKLKLKV
jgi:spore germination cell wall hydrolase CwlJ-like protein